MRRGEDVFRDAGVRHSPVVVPMQPGIGLGNGIGLLLVCLVFSAFTLLGIVTAVRWVWPW